MGCGTCAHNGHCEIRPDQIGVEPSVTTGNFGDFGRSQELLGDGDHGMVYNDGDDDHEDDHGAETVSGITSWSFRGRFDMRTFYISTSDISTLLTCYYTFNLL